MLLMRLDVLAPWLGLGWTGTFLAWVGGVLDGWVPLLVIIVLFTATWYADRD